MNEDLFVAHSKESAVDTVINCIKKLLLERKLKAGDRLPNENELSKRLGVSRGSTREAMKILSAYGLIDVRVGDGTYVASSLRSRMIEPLLYSFLLIDADRNELAEFRKYIEMDIARLIIEHSDQNGALIEQMRENVAQISTLQRAHAPMEAFVENDMAFHRLYGEACCNRLIEALYTFILDFFAQSIADTHRMQQEGARSLESHRMILDAIERGDPSIAEQSIDYTVEVWKRLQADVAAQ